MDFASVTRKVGELTNSASDAVSKLLDEFNAALPTLRALGFSMQDLRVSMGLLPEVSAKLLASADDIDVKSLDDMVRKNSDQKTLVALLRALQTAYNVRSQLGDVGLKGIEVDVTLGLPPRIGIGFLKSVAAATPALTATA